MISTASRLTVRGVVLRGAVVLGAAWLMAMSAQLQVNLWPVPITAQTLALPIVVALLGRNQAVLAMLAYLAEGAGGLPVFHGFAGGIAHLAGPTGGYLVALPFAAFAIGWLYERGLGKTLAGRFAAIFLGTAVVFAIGAAWLATLLHLTPLRAVAVGVTPFLIGNVAKCLIAAFVPPLWPALARRLGL